MITSKDNQTILLVEDEAGVRIVVRRFLEEEDYIVLEAADALQAIRLCQQGAKSVDLLITDVIMPHLSGPELARQLTQLYPTLKCLFISGYTGDELAAHEVERDNVVFLQKPFSADALISKVEEMLQ